MTSLSELKNTSRPQKTKKRLGRGIGSGKGKTCGKGNKGAKSRSGYKRRLGNEGGQRPVFRKIPIRGFSRGMFKEDTFSINLALLEKYFNEGDVINLISLREKNLISNKKSPSIKILGQGELTKSLTFEVQGLSKAAEEKIKLAKGIVKLIK